jgi:hypothetical protein
MDQNGEKWKRVTRSGTKKSARKSVPRPVLLMEHNKADRRVSSIPGFLMEQNRADGRVFSRPGVLMQPNRAEGIVPRSGFGMEKTEQMEQ